MIDKDKIVIHQTLHGYKEGHNLLATSIELSGHEKRILNVLTDYAGSGIEKGFTEYLTCYPIQSSKYYAISKTWYAEEMPRPGCVWTQTLLIDLSILWLVRNIVLLKSLFIRPKDQEFNIYNSSIELELSDVSIYTLNYSEYFPLISCQLYNNQKPIGILSTSSEQLETAILNTWLLQWPRLKRSFSFCTGAISPRKIGTGYLDLQIIPKSREWSLGNTDRKNLSIIDIEESECFSEWHETYLEKDKKDVYEYMRKMGADIYASSSNFKYLFQSYLYTKYATPTNSLNEFRQITSALSDNPEEGKLLKADILKTFWELSPSKLDAIREIASTHCFSTLKIKYANLIIDSYLGHLISNQQIIEAIKIVKDKLSEDEFMQLLVNLPFKTWLHSTDLYLEVLPKIISNNEFHIHESKELWKSEPVIQELWFEYLLNNPNTDWPKLIHTLISTNSNRFCERIAEKNGESLYSILFTWILENEQPLAADWLYLIKKNLAQSFSAFSELNNYNRELLRLFPSISSPTDQQWKHVSLSLIEKCLNKILSKSFEQEKAALQTFFITTAFKGILKDNLKATIFLFQPLHDNLSQNTFESTTWQRFQMLMATELYELIEVDFFSSLFSDRHKIPEWDRCEFLRRSLICTFINFDWNFKDFIYIVTDNSTFENIVKFCSEVKPLRKQMRSLAKELQKDTFHFRILTKYT